GFLMVGKAEALQSRTTLFEAVDLKNRVFVKRISADGGRATPPLPRRLEEFRHPHEDVLKESSFEQSSVAQLIVDAGGLVTSLNQALRLTFGLKLQDVGRPLQDLELSYRPVELRSLIDEAQRDRHTISRKDIEWARAGEQTRRLDVKVTPLIDATAGYVGALIAFVDVSQFRELADGLNRARRELETDYV